jgi:hypothetical protein
MEEGASWNTNSITGAACKDAANSCVWLSKRRESPIPLMERTTAPFPFAPPFLKHGDLIIPHVPNILLYLGPKLTLAPRDEAKRHILHGLQLTITDIVA